MAATTTVPVPTRLGTACILAGRGGQLCQRLTAGKRKGSKGKVVVRKRWRFASSGHYCFGPVLLVCGAVRRQQAAEECGQYRRVLAVEAPFPFGPFTEFAPLVDGSQSPRATVVTVGIASASATGCKSQWSSLCIIECSRPLWSQMGWQVAVG